MGLVDPTQAPERFAEASREFAQDTLPSDDDLREGRSWSSINHDLWSKYFESRSALSMVVRDPARVRSLVVEAATAAQNNDSGWRSGIVSRYRILVQTLANLIGEEPGLTPQQAQKQFLQETERGGEMIEDAFAQRFLILAGESFEGFQNDPAKEMTTGRLRNALDALGRIPIIGPDVADAVEPEIGAQAYNVVLGTNTTWVHRTLESIGEESLLQKILLRLLQADLPLYAQILHGPLEYGKDVVVLIEENGRNVLRMYQVKCGDITTPIWRNSRHELEEMFLVPLSDFQMPDSVDKREGILLCNGHANTYVIPAMEGWVKEQRDALGRDYRFMHLDDMVTWIINQRMINVFKSALSELGIDLAL